MISGPISWKEKTKNKKNSKYLGNLCKEPSNAKILLSFFDSWWDIQTYRLFLRANYSFKSGSSLLNHFLHFFKNGAFLPCYCTKSFISVSAFDLLINFPLELLTHLLFMFVLYTWSVVLIFQYINRKPMLVKLWVNPRKFSLTESFSIYRSSCSQGILWKSYSRKTCKIRRETPVPVSF